MGIRRVTSARAEISRTLHFDPDGEEDSEGWKADDEGNDMTRTLGK